MASFIQLSSGNWRVPVRRKGRYLAATSTRLRRHDPNARWRKRDAVTEIHVTQEIRISGADASGRITRPVTSFSYFLRSFRPAAGRILHPLSSDSQTPAGVAPPSARQQIAQYVIYRRFIGSL